MNIPLRFGTTSFIGYKSLDKMDDKNPFMDSFRGLKGEASIAGKGFSASLTENGDALTLSVNGTEAQESAFLHDAIFTINEDVFGTASRDVSWEDVSISSDKVKESQISKTVAAANRAFL